MSDNIEEMVTPEPINSSEEMPAPAPEPEHEPIDGKFELSISSDLTEAALTVYSSHFGGKDVTEQEVLSEIQSKGIVYGLNSKLISDIIKNKMFGKPYEIAKYTPPTDGVDGTLTYLFEQNVENKPKEDEKGFVDYRDLGIIRNIKAGTPIGTITFPTEGEPGTNIKGAPIAQKKGVEAKVPMGDNVVLNGDKSHIIAKCDGNLKFSGGKFSVETVYTMRGNVDASTGNLDFIGDIVVKGEVMEGFKVSSLKSITIFENTTGAVIEAGGDVVIKKGCINTKVTSHGNVSVDFCENSKITCDGDLKGDAFITSDIYCGGELIAQGKKGILMGGKYTCLKNLTANSIGSKSYAATLVTVGDNAIMLEEMDDCNKKLHEIDFQILRCTQAIDFLNEKKKIMTLPPEKEELLSSSVKSRIMLNMEKKKITSRIEEIKAYLENKENLSITCKKELYPGTKIIINDFVFAVNDKYQYCKIFLDEDGIKTETL